MAAMKLYMTPGSCSTGIHIILEEMEEAFEAYIVNLPANLAALYRRMPARPAVHRVLREEGYDTAALGRLSARQSTDLAT